MLVRPWIPSSRRDQNRDVDAPSGHPDHRRVVSRRRLVAGAVVGVGALFTTRHVVGLDAFGDGATISGAQQAERLSRPDRRRWSTEQVGSSVEGRPIHLLSNAAEHSQATVLAIAAVHGDERGAGAVGADLTTVVVPAGVSAFVVPIANPDGWARGIRNNANDVDLNRNFPWWWDRRDGGPSPASEPETQALIAVVQRLRPTVTVWIHQPYEYVSPIDPQVRPLAETWATAAGLSIRPFVSQHGGGESWTYYGEGLASILVEGVTRESSIGEISAHRRGFEALLAAL